LVDRFGVAPCCPGSIRLVIDVVLIVGFGVVRGSGFDEPNMV
jgi:hypothetical protein